jgi:hypothetical protein
VAVSESVPVSAEPYRPRRTEWLGVTECAGWQVKQIAIVADGGSLSEAELMAAFEAAERDLPQPPRAESRLGAGFVIAHRGAAALWVLVCWWESEILYERMWRADLGTADLRRMPPDGPTACVWELLAIDHERRAWIEHVLRRPAAPDISGYLSAAASAEVSPPHCL